MLSSISSSRDCSGAEEVELDPDSQLDRELGREEALDLDLDLEGEDEREELEEASPEFWEAM